MVFIPTYLYIKQHSITGKLYFGKTTKNPEIYRGSGKHWTSHYKKHGKEYIETLWYCLFFNAETIKEFALNFSKEQHIVKSDQWLNLKDENGLDGGSMVGTQEGFQLGRIFTREHRDNMSIAAKGRIISNEHKLNLSLAHKTRIYKPNAIVQCPHCDKTGGIANMKRYHFDNCKMR